MRWTALVKEWLARRSGRRNLESDLPRSARDIVGPTGWVWSGAWDELAKHQSTYLRSFDPKVPPSIFVSERERTRHNIPIPVAERMLETHRRERGSEPDRPGSDSL